MPEQVSTSVRAGEIARFDAMADRWWDTAGPMRALLQMNPARIGWIAERVGRHFPASADTALLDIGCGGGIAAEALARRGYRVLGVDAAAAAIVAARRHADGLALPLAYRQATADDLLAEDLRFNVITALEVIEHVEDPANFIATLRALLAPGGLLFLSTLNRTRRSYLAAKVGAEYLLRWLPPGTHDWRRFIMPDEMGTLLRAAGLRVADLAGLAFDPLSGSWRTGHDLSVNYIAMAAASD